MSGIGGRGRARRGEAWGELVVLSREAALAGGGPLRGDMVALVQARDEASGLETARVMLYRAGRPLDVVLVHGCPRGGDAEVADALARRMEGRALVLAGAPVFAGQGWASRAATALEGARALVFETGGAPAVALDRAWAAGRLPQALGEVAQVAARDPAALLLDLDPPGGPADPAITVEVVDAAGTAPLDPGRAETTAVVMPCIDVARGRAAAERLAGRAGAPARILIALDAERRGFVATLNAVARPLAARRLAYVAEDAFPGPDWLARGLAALDAPGRRLLGFNCGKWDGRIAAFGLMDLDWARGLYGGPVMHPGYRAHRADNELTVIARAQDAYAHDPSAVLLERDVSKAMRSGEAGLPGYDPSDRKLFRHRFRSGFDGLAPRGALLALAPDYLGPGQASAVAAALA